MFSLNKISVIPFLFISVFAGFLTGCANNTRNLEPSLQNANQASIRVTKKIDDLLSVSGSLNYFQGSDSETVEGSLNNTIQLDNMRFTGTDEDPLFLDYDVDLLTSTLLVNIKAYEGDIYKLEVSPGFSYFNADVNTTVNDGITFSNGFNSFGIGAQINNTFKFNDKWSVELSIASFDNFDNDTGQLFTLGALVSYSLNENWKVGLGAQSTSINGDSIEDGCGADSVPADCQNSLLDLGSSGLLLRLDYNF